MSVATPRHATFLTLALVGWVDAHAGVGDPLKLESLEIAAGALTAVEATANAPHATPVSLGGGLYTYVLDASQPFETVSRTSHATWVYSGQAVFDLVSNRGGWVWAGEGAPLTAEGQAEQDAQRVRVDRWGRRWKLESRDFNASARGDDVHDSGAHDSGRPQVADEERIEPGWMLQNSWTLTDCDMTGEPIDRRVFDGESRSLVDTFVNDRARANVAIEVIGIKELVAGVPNFNVLYTCSGVMVCETLVLTVGHCISSGSSTSELDPAFIRVCVAGNFDLHNEVCSEVASVDVNPAYLAGTHDVNEDFGLLELEDSIVGPDVPFSLSTTPSSSWSDFDVRNHAYPTFDLQCAKNSWFAENDFSISYDLVDGMASGVGLKQFSQFDSFLGLGPATVRTRLDGGGGHSGSPFFITPGGVNAIIGVWAAWSPVLDKHFGPRLEEFEVFVQTAL